MAWTSARWVKAGTTTSSPGPTPAVGVEDLLDGALEVADVAAHAQPAAPQRLLRGLDLLLLDQGPVDGYALDRMLLRWMARSLLDLLGRSMTARR
jgi:hypothetical protein